MSHAPLVSVLVPVRDGGPFLAQAVASLQAQAFDNWEAILCGVDGTPTPGVDDPRIRHAEVVGANDADAIEQASALATGNYLCVLDGDDELAPTAFAELLGTFESRPDAGMVYSRHVLVDGAGRVVAPGPLCELPYSPDALLLDFMTGPLQLIRRDAFNAAGGFDATLPDAADYDLCLRLSETGTIEHVALPLYRRRVHPRSPAMLRWVEQIEDRYRAFVDAVQRRGLDARYDCALEIDSWHILQPLRPFGGVGNWR